ncbi:MAG: hypothetical protein PHW82_15715 [Bacteroidales bacterium]|nr:hypothetical protein [Bacteroidales bacterium]
MQSRKLSLLDIYKERNKDKDWLENYSGLSKNKFGRLFEYTNTNFRTQKAFITGFEKFLEIENKERSRWVKSKNAKQETHKQMVVNLVQSKLFKKNISSSYSRTKKGFLYGKFIEEEMQSSEKWLTNYLFLLNGYYFNRKNYIINRTEDLLGYLLSVNEITEELLISKIKEILKLTKNSFSEMIRKDFLYIHSFYNDSDFLTIYLRSSLNEKEELAEYIETNRNNKDYRCCISKKYQISGNFNQSMLLDETKVFLLTFLFIKADKKNLNNVYQVVVDIFNDNITILDKNFILDYLYKNRDIFDPIFEEILDLDEERDLESELIGKVDFAEERLKDIPEDYIDETSREGKQKLKTIYGMRKKQAKIESNYTCALEKINNCKPIYFTAKANNKNYTELHHLIPREFRNDFPCSIEVLANYVVLCPRCHRQIHLATDRERKHLINALYNERIQRLKTVGLDLDLEKIYEYYQIK